MLLHIQLDQTDARIPLHDRTIFRHIDGLKPAVLRPLECVLYFLLQLGRHSTFQGSLQRHYCLLAALLRLRHAESSDAFPQVCFGVTRVEFGGESSIQPRLLTNEKQERGE